MNNLLKTKWEKGKSNTIYFYKKKLPWKNKELNRERYLPDFFSRMIGDKKDVKICELGAGMFCTIGSLWKTAKVKIYASDALSDEFNQILKEHNVTALTPLEKQDMENLTYPDNFFDIVYCCNALDHCTNPLKAIKEMFRVAKPGGWIYLKHVINVGEHEKYAGLHMWNIDLGDNNECIIWNQKEKFPLENFVPGFVNTIDNDSEIPQIVSLLHKK
jgi:ubiquinone/menaquinone biosynthesis C-methylase UbiE